MVDSAMEERGSRSDPRSSLAQCDHLKPARQGSLVISDLDTAPVTAMTVTRVDHQ